MNKDLSQVDMELVRAASEVIAQNYHEPHHTVGTALLCCSGKTYTAVNVGSVGYGPCAEPIALGAAISSGERKFRAIVTTRPDGTILPPCGNCRQLLLEYAPDLAVILQRDGALVRVPIRDLLPSPYTTPQDSPAIET